MNPDETVKTTTETSKPVEVPATETHTTETTESTTVKPSGQ